MFKKISFLALTIYFGTFSFASAHVKWFVDSQEVVENSHNLTSFYSITSSEVVVWVLISVFVLAMFSFLDKLINVPKGLLYFAEKHNEKINRVAQGLLGIFFITVSLLWNIILVPEFPVNDTFSTILKIIQIIIGLMLVLNIKPKIASLGIIALCFILLFKVGALAFFENIMLLALGVYFFIRNRPVGSFFNKIDEYGIEIVRLGTGVSLIVMAFTEKFAYPELALAFLDVHQWNFMQLMGMSFFSNELFVLSTGFAEMIFGLVFIFGYLTRINTVLISSFFATSVITMAVQFGAWEVEDLVVYSAAILFIFFGHGKTNIFHFSWPDRILNREKVLSYFK